MVRRLPMIFVCLIALLTACTPRIPGGSGNATPLAINTSKPIKLGTFGSIPPKPYVPPPVVPTPIPPQVTLCAKFTPIDPTICLCKEVVLCQYIGKPDLIACAIGAPYCVFQGIVSACGARDPLNVCPEPSQVAKDFEAGLCQIYCVAKPVVYLYPTNPMFVDVSLVIPGIVTVSDPQYPTGGWQNVLAYPNGVLSYNGAPYRYLYYETDVTKPKIPETGIIMPRVFLRPLLQNTTAKLGLNAGEQQDFVDYWLPRLEETKAPYIVFSVLDPQEKEEIDHVTIAPEPDTRIEFLAHFTPVQTYREVQPLVLPQTPPVRQGFTMVEWGGSIAE